MTPIEHVVELTRVAHVPLQGGQEDLRCIAEDDNAQCDGEGAPVEAERYLGPLPVGNLYEAIAKDNDVQHDVSDATPETQCGHGSQIGQECTRQQQHGAQHHPRSLIDDALGEGADEQVTTEDNVEDARHKQFNDLRSVDQFAAVPFAHAILGDLKAGNKLRISFEVNPRRTSS